MKSKELSPQLPVLALCIVNSSPSPAGTARSQKTIDKHDVLLRLPLEIIGAYKCLLHVADLDKLDLCDIVPQMYSCLTRLRI